MNILITICARGGSKGIPGKNIKIINGKPLIYYSLNTATNLKKELGNIDIALSTDDAEIKDTVKQLGFDVDTTYTRPDFLASDTAGKVDAIYDVLNYNEQKNGIAYDYVLDLDVTSPLRTVDDLKQAINIITANKDALNLFSVSPANRNPYFNMVEEQASGYFTTCKQGAFLTRQSAPNVYDMNASFYIYTKEFFTSGQKKAITDKSVIYEVPHLCFDLDHPIDFTIMNLLLEHGELNFEI